MDPIPEHLKKAATGAVLGVASGLFADSMLLLNYGGWMFLFFPVIIAIPFSGGLLLGFIGWKCLSFKLPSPAIFIAAIILWPLAFMGPIWCKEISLQSSIDAAIAPYPQAVPAGKRVTAIPGDAGASIQLEFKTPANLPEVSDYYRQELIAKGWRLTADTGLKRGYHGKLIEGRYLAAVKARERLVITIHGKNPDVGYLAISAGYSRK